MFNEQHCGIRIANVAKLPIKYIAAYVNSIATSHKKRCLVIVGGKRSPHETARLPLSPRSEHSLGPMPCASLPDETRTLPRAAVEYETLRSYACANIRISYIEYKKQSFIYYLF